MIRRTLYRVCTPAAGMLGAVAAWNAGDLLSRWHRRRAQAARVKYPPPAGFRAYTAAGLPQRIPGHDLDAARRNERRTP